MAQINPSIFRPPQTVWKKLTKFYGRRIMVHTNAGITYSGFLRHIYRYYDALLMVQTLRRNPNGSLVELGKCKIATADVIKICLFRRCRCDEPSSVSSATSSAMESVDDSEQSVVIHESDLATESDQTTETEQATESVTNNSGLPESAASDGFESEETVLPEETTDDNDDTDDSLSVSLESEETDSNE